MKPPPGPDKIATNAPRIKEINSRSKRGYRKKCPNNLGAGCSVSLVMVGFQHPKESQEKKASALRTPAAQCVIPISAGSLAHARKKKGARDETTDNRCKTCLLYTSDAADE